jgi:hypothetical protein
MKISQEKEIDTYNDNDTRKVLLPRAATPPFSLHY